MTKKKINIADYAGVIMEAIPKGVLLTTKNGDKVNSMSIGWGMIGYEWSTPIFTAFVRTGRFTHEQLTANPEFTVNIPYGEYDRGLVGYCGSTSGRDTDKVTGSGMTLVEPEEISVPGIREMPLTLECRVVYRQTQDEKGIDGKFSRYYPQDVDSSCCGSNRDPHTAFYGEIVAAYIIED